MPTLGFPTNTLIASQAWMPSICVPAGFTDSGFPVGMEIVVYPYHEPDLFRLGYAFEQADASSQGAWCTARLAEAFDFLQVIVASECCERQSKDLARPPRAYAIDRSVRMTL